MFYPIEVKCEITTKRFWVRLLVEGVLIFFLQGIINTCARCCRRYKRNPHNLLHLGLNLDKSGVDQTLYTRQAVFYGRTVSLYSAIIVEVKR